MGYFNHVIMTNFYFLAVPGATNEPVVEDITADSVNLAWSPPKEDGGADITDYIIEKKDKFSPRWTKVDKVPSDQTNLKIGKLKEGDEYEFRVIPVNKAGEGKPSPPASATPKAPYGKL